MPTDKNKWMSKSSYVRFWNGIIKAMGAEDLTAHIFRHNYATMLYYSNVSIKMAAKLMGHNSINMIMEIYAHLDEMQERTAEKLNDVFKKNAPAVS
jgi:integrase